MRAARLMASGELVVGDAPRPQAGPREVLVRVAAAGVTTMELSWYPTTHTAAGEPRIGAVPGHEFSGVVEALGKDVGELEIGGEVFGMNDWYSDGAQAEYCVAPLSALAPKPRRLTHQEAAAVPIGALTAWQALFDHAKLQSGERVLIHGGAGAVGVFAIQLARRHGAHIATTVSASNVTFVSELGAEQVIDYRSSRFEDNVADLDVVLDTVGGETLDRSWGVLKPSGRMVTIASTVEESTDPRQKQAFFIVEPNGKQLLEIADLLESAQLRSVVDSVVPLSQAPETYAGTLRRHGRGKVVISIGNTH